jgi:hypothetical protein
MEDPGLIVGQEAKIPLFAMIVQGHDGGRFTKIAQRLLLRLQIPNSRKEVVGHPANTEAAELLLRL